MDTFSSRERGRRALRGWRRSLSSLNKPAEHDVPIKRRFALLFCLMMWKGVIMLLHAISTGSMTPDHLLQAAAEAAPWLDAVHIREPAWSPAATKQTAAAWEAETKLIINMKTPGAAVTDCGLHLPEVMPVHPRMQGRSVHTPEAAVKAEAEGASYVIAGPLYPPLSKEAASVLGLTGLEAICRAVQIPVIAVGGIQPGKLQEAAHAGAAGAAVITAVFGSEHPAQSAYELREEALMCSMSS
ncbi:thiamine phosphate synthase [Alkalicoccus chagannorensis]|uniref:thiamine phosphate synthase n=1 Tax=Alkalicoccus chagannorensis TaxID=427072 RepID=UPI0012EBAEB0|nr:thiamine phosphate synthase [Alkalicoccus chagannorensis]